MYELKVTVKKVMGKCTADPPMKPGDYFTVSDGDLQVPEGGYICLWALQSLIPLITPKEREISENKDEDWMWRVHHAQCPDPKGRVIFKIERTGKIEKDSKSTPEIQAVPKTDEENDMGLSEGGLKNLRIEVESVKGQCTSRMKLGDRFMLRSGRLYIPPGCHFCLYALQATLPLLPAKQRVLQDGDWMKEECRVLCPDPAGNVILRINRME
ncbi:MAG: TIGR04076 family protein, partial [Anaerolineae bacterium]